MKAPTSMLSQRLLRREGYYVVVVEKYEPFVFDPIRKVELAAAGKPTTRKRDLLGIADLLALGSDRPGHPARCPMLVQTTSVTNLAAHREKALCAILTQPKDIDADGAPASALALWLRSGGRFQLHGWKQDQATKRWECRREEAFASFTAPATYRIRTVLPGGIWLSFRDINPPAPKQGRLKL